MPDIGQNIFTTLVTSLQNITQAINKVGQVFQNTIPQVGGAVSATATGGAVAPPALVVGYMPVTFNGVQYKVPLYSP
jgi:phage-related protein